MIDIIKDTIDKFPIGFVFTSSDFPIVVNRLIAVDIIETHHNL